MAKSLAGLFVWLILSMAVWVWISKIFGMNMFHPLVLMTSHVIAALIGAAMVIVDYKVKE